MSQQDIQEFIDMYKLYIHQNSSDSHENSCRIWNNQQGTGTNTYTRIKVKLPGKTRHIFTTVHRLSYMLDSKNFELDPQKHVSHLCHNKFCIKVEHLTYESPSSNESRKPCAKIRVCQGHVNAPNCIFQ